MTDRFIIANLGDGGLTTTLQDVTNMAGDFLPFRISSAILDVDAISVNGTTFPAGLTDVTASSTELNILDGATLSTAELNILDGATLLTAELNILDGVTATFTELNAAADDSANTETITVSAAASVTKRHTAIDNTVGGAGAITLAAPGATMIGKVKIIEMTVDAGDVTLSLANVTGGSAATTATFGDVNDALVLVGGTNKWHVVAESGVVLS